jgi:hypothetical protein
MEWPLCGLFHGFEWQFPSLSVESTPLVFELITSKISALVVLLSIA